MKSKLIIITIIISGFFLYPFSCTGQISVPPGGGDDGCDTVFVDDPALEAEREGYKNQIEGLNVEVNVQRSLKEQALASLEDYKTSVANLEKDVLNLNTQILNLNEVIGDMTNTIVLKDAEIANLEERLQNSSNEPEVITVGGVQYVVADIELILPRQEVDTIIVSHCDSTKLTTWFHHGGVAGYPHDISFNTKEKGFVRVHFKDSLTNEIKVQPEYKLQRIKDYSTAETYYIFIE